MPTSPTEWDGCPHRAKLQGSHSGHCITAPITDGVHRVVDIDSLPKMYRQWIDIDTQPRKNTLFIAMVVATAVENVCYTGISPRKEGCQRRP